MLQFCLCCDTQMSILGEIWGVQCLSSRTLQHVEELEAKTLPFNTTGVNMAKEYDKQTHEECLEKKKATA